MNKNTEKLITIVPIVASVVIVIILLIYASAKINKEENKMLQEEFKTYFNQIYKNDDMASKSPFFGLLNFNFENINNMSTESLIYTNIMSSSEMNSIGIDNIYQKEFNMTKKEYITSPKYLSNPYSNCYYYQNVLKKSGFNCDKVCSQGKNAITQSIYENLEWSNVLPDDIQKYCIKNAIYPIETKGYFVNLSDVKELFKSLTNKELTFDSKITNNKYYKYDAYLETESLRLEDNIKEITSVTDVKTNKSEYVVEYTALTEKNKTLTGKVTLERIENDYFVVSNEINTDNYLN